MVKVHALQTVDCNQWFFYMLDFSSKFEVNLFFVLFFGEFHLKTLPELILVNNDYK